jgi:DNA repair protein RadD
MSYIATGHSVVKIISADQRLAIAAPTLRPYQEADLAAVRATYAGGSQRVLYQAPTGSGKTVLFAYIVAAAVTRGNRVVILGHRQEIVDQISAALDALGVPHGLILAGHPETPNMPVQVASVATLVRRLDRLQGCALIVVDEAHHAVAGTWNKIINAVSDAKVLGVTATPERLDGKGLHSAFDELVIGPTIAELTAGGYLAPSTCFAPERLPDLSRLRTRMGDFALDQLGEAMSNGLVIGSAVDEYAKRCSGAPAIAFCVDIHHSILVAERFAQRGYSAAHLDGDTPKDERRRLIAALGGGELQVISNCGLISEGLDVPTVHAAILLRPTKSLALYLQQVGRVLRPAPGKQRAIILDHAGNVFRHGLPEIARDWSLADRPRRSGDAPVKRCPNCGAIVALATWNCPECGAVLRVQQRSEITSRLAIVDMTEQLRAMSYQQALRWAGHDKDRLRLLARARAYKAGWVFRRLQELRQRGAA